MFSRILFQILAMLRLLSPMMMIIIMGGCEPRQVSGPEDIHWDRQVCTHCSMSLGDHRFASQIRSPQNQVFYFDDIGCSLIWLDQQSWKSDADAEIWVTDFDNGNWLDARSAWYVAGLKSPMGYNLGAVKEQTDLSFNYDKAVEHIFQFERQRRTHYGSHQHAIDSTNR